eukprot:CAMPEP_0197034958 /NCGR_PEP_ID=MMETSP1384-20130603/12878_1 /TAXON_ID=29189 /ORGANISM="Ammonia sp." /LENGTH=616 /DNA_ID=CAMNT_0042464937 /DNA_START=58 /DNA_END=1908 /DNA_ORIENTATION=-
MSFELLGGAGTLYPLYSDLDSEAEPSPSPAPRQQASSLTVNYPFYRRNVPLSRKNSGNRTQYNSRRDQVQIYRHNRPSYSSYQRHRHSPKTHSLDTVSSISNLSVASTPRPFIASDGDGPYQSPSPQPPTCTASHPMQQQFAAYTVSQTSAANMTQTNDENHTNTAKPNATCTSMAGHAQTQQQAKKGKKRRTRTFYSKKWGNRLYGLTQIDYSMIATTPTPPPPARQTIADRGAAAGNAESERVQTNANIHHFIHNHYNSQHLELWNKELQHQHVTRSASPPTYTEEEQFDINDIRSPRSVSPSATPMHLTVDFGLVPDHNDSCYDSAVSNVAANTDAEHDDEDDDEDEDDLHVSRSQTYFHHHQQQHQQQQQRDNVEHDDRNGAVPAGANSNGRHFKIVVSAPNRCEDREQDAERDERNAFKARMRTRRARKRYFLRDGGVSDDCSSSDDAGDTTANEEEDEEEEMEAARRRALYNKAGLFLGGNDVHRGVYSQFSDISEESDTDYMSAQSDDFDELTICYRNNKNVKNIKFREQQEGVHDTNDGKDAANDNGSGKNDGCHLQVINSTECNYLSELGQSDIGSSDTECYSSADSIPDSIPPPMDENSEFLSDLQ